MSMPLIDSLLRNQKLIENNVFKIAESLKFCSLQWSERKCYETFTVALTPLIASLKKESKYGQIGIDESKTFKNYGYLDARLGKRTCPFYLVDFDGRLGTERFLSSGIDIFNQCFVLDRFSVVGVG